jgi:hypothetical protein
MATSDFFQACLETMIDLRRPLAQLFRAMRNAIIALEERRKPFNYTANPCSKKATRALKKLMPADTRLL